MLTGPPPQFQLVIVVQKHRTGRTGAPGPQVWPHFGPMDSTPTRVVCWGRQHGGEGAALSTITDDHRGGARLVVLISHHPPERRSLRAMLLYSDWLCQGKSAPLGQRNLAPAPLRRRVGDDEIDGGSPAQGGQSCSPAHRGAPLGYLSRAVWLRGDWMKTDAWLISGTRWHR
jgi:hypothetical protein